MKILLIDIDSKIPNLALMKISAYHKKRGDTVELNNYLCNPDKVYVSCIFTENAYKVKQLPFNDMVVGGSGLENWAVVLPNEIEYIMPDYFLYGSDYSLGFTTRGCIRKCPFCIVPEKEGKIRVVGDIYNIWDSKFKDIILLDNNILALPKHFKKICQQLRKEKLRVDFNQGLDCRLLTEDMVKDLKLLSHIEYRFAFDDIRLKPIILKTIRLLRKYGINRCNWYVLVGFNSTLEEDLERLNLLKKYKQDAYVQRYNRTKDRQYIPLARWANQQHMFHSMTYEEFLNKCKKEIGGKYKTEFMLKDK